MGKISGKHILIAALVLAALVYVANFNFQRIGYINDDAYYINAARWLAGAQRVQKDFSSRSLGFAFVLAPVAAVCGAGNTPFRIPSLIFSLASVYLAYLLFSTVAGEKTALIIALMTAFNPLTVIFAPAVMSEETFLFFELLSIFLFMKYRTAGVFSPKKILFISLSLSFASFIRPEGFLLIACIVTALAVSGKRRDALYTAFFSLIFLLPVLIKSAGLGAGIDKYIDELFFPYFHGAGLSPLIKNAGYFAGEISYSVFLTEFARARLGGLKIIPEAAILTVLAAGFIKGNAEKGNASSAVIKTYTVMYLLFHIVWPSRGERFLIAVLPFLFFIFFGAVERAGKKAAAYSCAFFMLLFAWQDFLILDYRMPPLTPETFAFVKNRTPREAVFASDIQARFFLLTGRKTINPPVVFSADDFYYILAREKAEFVAMFNEKLLATEYAFPTVVLSGLKRIRKIVGNKKMFDVFYVNRIEETVIFRVKDDYREMFMRAFELYIKSQKSVEKGDDTNAEKYLSDAIGINPYFTKAYNALALFYIDRGKFAEAEKILNEVQNRESFSYISFFIIGNLYKTKGELRKALENYKKAAELAGEIDDFKIRKAAENEIDNLNRL